MSGVRVKPVARMKDPRRPRSRRDPCIPQGPTFVELLATVPAASLRELEHRVVVPVLGEHRRGMRLRRPPHLARLGLFQVADWLAECVTGSAGSFASAPVQHGSSE